jgi:threonine dehydrogenase-like Zn-dependent dehydrogenase
MPCGFEDYRGLNYKIPEKTIAWNMYNAGVENVGRNGKPEEFAVSEPNDNQMLVRVDSVGLCFSDVKLIKLGGSHPKLYGQDLSTNPTRLGHEAAFTVVKVGKNLAGKYHPGQRLAIQPDIYHNQISTAYGYTIPGGLTQYHLIGPEVLEADNGAYVISVEGDIGYAETALTEPWACVDAAYTQRRRLYPKTDGVMWIVGQPGDETNYTFTKWLDAPKKIYMTNVPESLKEVVRNNMAKGVEVIETTDIQPDEYLDFSKETTDGNGFDDIILLVPKSGKIVGEVAKLIAFRGTLNIVGQEPLDGESLIDAGRIHYHYITYIGTNSIDISASYGEKRNRCELKTGGTAMFIGAGGPMGQMHVQRAVEKKDGPSIIIATEINQERLMVLKEIINPLAEVNGKKFETFNPANSDLSLQDFIIQVTGKNNVDDAVVCVPVATLMEESVKLLKPDGMLVLFAGVPNGTYMKVSLDSVYLHNQQLTGTSGSKLKDQEVIINKTVKGELNPNRSVAAIGGIEVAREGLEAMMSGKFAGKIIIFPQISGLPLIGLKELKECYPSIGEKLGENNLWTIEAEKALIEEFWYGDKK